VPQCQQTEQNFPSGFFFFLREDVMKIRRAFEKLTPPLKEYSKPGELIALRHAMTNYLGRHSGLAGVIRVSLTAVSHRSDILIDFLGSLAICSCLRICASIARSRASKFLPKAS